MTQQPTPPPADADHDDWAPCQGHPPCASAGPVGCSDHWPPPTADDPPGDHSACVAEVSGPPMTRLARTAGRTP